MIIDRQTDNIVNNKLRHAESISAPSKFARIGKALKRVQDYKARGFTLAEVLITLGIIGIVAAMTIPTLVNNYQKHETVTRLQKTYSCMMQAIKLSEIDNGPASDWDYGDGSADATTAWYHTYFGPYLKSAMDITSVNDNIYVSLADGTKLGFFKGTYMDVYVWLDPSKTDIPGKNTFYFDLCPGKKVNTFRPFEAGNEGVAGRTKYTTGTGACTSTGTKKYYCAGLIMYDGWKISDDYPW